MNNNHKANFLEQDILKYNETKHEMLTNKVCIQYQTKIILL